MALHTTVDATNLPINITASTGSINVVDPSIVAPETTCPSTVIVVKLTRNNPVGVSILHSNTCRCRETQGIVSIIASRPIVLNDDLAGLSCVLLEDPRSIQNALV
ncbi:hypothetical protein EK21DRAFT_84993 [Setomelanomma holmii]|uniref:Uncharacterized protein n=1 Tax=Setomelanomma holmii TaxID=210430 RepID=A0A9P4LTM1_9PLEO|nr:hypothetical protein EK21DRAFT_84993 [Setomelanomma holmii]